MCVLEPTVEGVLTAPEGWTECTEFNMMRLSRINIWHDVIVLCVLSKLYIVTSVDCQTGEVETIECKAGECQYICSSYWGRCGCTCIAHWSTDCSWPAHLRCGLLVTNRGTAASPKHKLLSRSTDNCIVSNYAVYPSAAGNVIASHCTCVASLLQKQGATVK
jgi:hypothetical protein